MKLRAAHTLNFKPDAITASCIFAIYSDLFRIVTSHRFQKPHDQVIAAPLTRSTNNSERSASKQTKSTRLSDNRFPLHALKELQQTRKCNILLCHATISYIQQTSSTDHRLHLWTDALRCGMIIGTVQTTSVEINMY